MFSKNKIKTISIIVMVLLALTLVNYLVNRNEPDIENYVKKEFREWNGIDLGNYTTYESVSKTLQKDSIMFKIIISNSNTRVVADGITYRKDDDWKYHSLIFKAFSHSESLDSARRNYLDGSLTSW